jgi:hypothetical protein
MIMVGLVPLPSGLMATARRCRDQGMRRFCRDPDRRPTMKM